MAQRQPSGRGLAVDSVTRCVEPGLGEVAGGLGNNKKIDEKLIWVGIGSWTTWNDGGVKGVEDLAE